MIICWCCGVMVLCSAYTSKLFSDNLAKISSLPFKDFDTFVECLEEKRCLMIASTLSVSYYLHGLAGLETNLGRRIQATWKERPALVKLWSEIPTLIMQEQNAYLVWITDKDEANLCASNNDCKVYIIETSYAEIWAFPMRKKSPLREILNKASAAFRERGFGQGLATRYRYGAICHRQFNEMAQPTFVSSTTAAALCFYCTGILAGTMTLVVEIMTHRWLRQKLPSS